MVWLDMIADRLFGDIEVHTIPACARSSTQIERLSRQQWRDYQTSFSGALIQGFYAGSEFAARSVGCKNCGAAIQPTEHTCSYCKSPR